MLINAMSDEPRLQQQPSAATTVKKAAALIMVAMMMSRILGIIRYSSLGAFFGGDLETDAFLAAFNIPDLLYFMVSGGAMTGAFIPIYTDFIVSNRREEGRRVASTIWNMTACVVVAGILLGEIFAPQLVKLFPSISGDPVVYRAGILFVRLLYPMVLFTSMAALCNGILQAHNHFASPAASWLVYNLCFIAATFLFRHQVGLKGVCLGVLFGAAMMVAVQVPALYAKGFRYRFSLDWRHPSVVGYWKMFFPVMLGLSLSQINLFLVPSFFGSLVGEGKITQLIFANRVIFAPLGIFGSAISMAIFPTLSRMAEAGEFERIGRAVARAIRVSLIFALPCTALFMTLSLHVVKLTVGIMGGLFKYDDCVNSALAVVYFSIGLIGHTSNQMLSRGFFSMKDSKTPLIAGLVGLAVTPPLAFVLIRTPLQHAGVALAISVGALANLAWLLARAKGKLHLDPAGIYPMFFKTAFAAVAMGAAAWAAGRAFPIGPDRFDLLSVLKSFGASTVVSGAIFVILVKAMRIEEFDELTGMVLRRFGGKK